ncbi:hypothetical protein [Hydrogenothermus marinus]|uniref:DUF8082 domain-containing protein n=1 Tax=Hydrogenothermus marinus TaxID=133270 RepID=A0A3M0BFI1_9AQUI|nr:hypothetical protein [Hydrogenothermus marinus]RMA96070.1 hypothetical protein CLV39_1081 [Hydrogenothermus marinus]
MEDLKFYSDALFDLANKVNAYFTAIYIGEEPFLSYCRDKNKENTLTEILSLLIRKMYTSEELIEGFGTEYAFAEGKDFAIFLLRIKDDIFVATIIDENPNFALLKYENEKLSKKLIDKIEDIKNLKGSKEQQEHMEKEEIPSEIEQLEESLKEKEEVPSSKEISEEEIPYDIENLEEVLSNNEESLKEQEKVSEKENSSKIKNLEEEISTEQKEIEEKVPSLEEILEEGEDIPVEEDILNELKQEFIKEIGPVGKILFNTHLKNLGKITKKNLKLFTDKLADEIPEEERKLKFLQEIKSIIKGGNKE